MRGRITATGGELRGVVLGGLATAMSFVCGCASDPLDTYRIGEEMDMTAFLRKYGEESVRNVTLAEEGYAYRECTFRSRGVGYAVDVSPDGRIVGLTARVSCGADEILETSTDIRNRLDVRYAGGRSAAEPGQVEIWIKYEPGSKRVVATCCESAHWAVVRSYRRRTKKPER